MADKSVSAPKPPEKKRPSFSAPTPPKTNPADVLENNEEEIAVLRDIYEEEDPEVKTATEEESPTQVIDAEQAVEMPESHVEVEHGSMTESEELESVLDDIEADEERELNSSGGGVSVVSLVIFVLLLLFGLVGWFLYLQETGMFVGTSETNLGEAPSETISPTQAPEQAPTPTVAQLSREEITLEVLNGSGVPGAAGEAASTLEGLGYPEVEVGNANSTAGNELYLNPEYEGLVTVLLEDLEAEFDIATVSGILEDAGELVGRIVLGE